MPIRIAKKAVAKTLSVMNGKLIHTGVKTKKFRVFDSTGVSYNYVDTNYYGVYIESINGKHERCMVLTEKELERTSRIVSKDLNDDIVLGRMYNATIRGTEGYIIKMSLDKEEFIVCITSAKLKVWLSRAYKNPQYIPKKSKLADMLD